MGIQVNVDGGSARDIKPERHQTTVRSVLEANGISIGPRDRIDLDDVAGRPESDCRGVLRIEITRGAHVVQEVVGAVR